MTDQSRVKCSAAAVYRDRHMAIDRQFHVTDPDGQQFVFCSGACLLSYAVHGALPVDVQAPEGDTSTRVRSSMIRPPDPAIVGTTLTYMPIESAEAVPRLVHLAFRDCTSALDLTHAHGRFWRAPLPPGLFLTSNNVDPSGAAELHLDFTATGLSDGSYDLAVYDPPHVADAGANGIMGARYGSIRGTEALRDLIEDGAREAWRLARVGMLVKVADHSHQGEHHALSDWVKAVVPMRPYLVLHTYRATYLRDGKHRALHVPRNNGATYLAFRKAGHRHVDFDRLYERQPARAENEAIA